MAKEKLNLTVNQSKFVELLGCGMGKREAYKQAFGCSLAAAGPGATKLLKLDRIKAKLAKIERISAKVATAKAVLSREEKQRLLAEQALREGRFDDATVSDSRQSIQELNRMDGDLAPAKSENLTIQANGTIDQLLQALAGSSSPTSWRELDS